MGNKDGHLRKAEHNNQLLNTFNFKRTRYPDWLVVIIFYTALHYVDAYLATRGFVKISDHKERNRLVEKYLPSVIEEWWLLYDQSQAARYDTGFQIAISEVNTYKNDKLSTIKAEIISLLS